MAFLLPLLLGGCGPTREELLVYEMIVVCVGLVLGMTLWGIGYRLGRRMAGPWFVCSHCLTPQTAMVRDGRTQPCALCGQTSSVNELDRQTLREVLSASGKRVSTRPAWRWSLLLTACTLLVFVCIRYTVSRLSQCGVTLSSVLPDCLLFPLAVCTGEWHDWTAVFWPGTGLYFVSWHIVGATAKLMQSLGWDDDIVGITVSNVVTAVVIGLHWHVGLCRWRRGWLLPLGVAGGNTAAALAGYLLNWPA